MPKFLEGHTRPVAQNLFAGALLEALLRGIPALVTWYTVHKAALEGWSTTSIIVAASFVFCLLSIGLDRLLRSRSVKISEKPKDQTLAEHFAGRSPDEAKTPRGKLKIVKGRYWVQHPTTGEVKETDVTRILGALVSNNTLQLDRRYQALFPDPLRGFRKNLTIDYQHHELKFSLTVVEGTGLSLPIPYSEIM